MAIFPVLNPLGEPHSLTIAQCNEHFLTYNQKFERKAAKVLHSAIWTIFCQGAFTGILCAVRNRLSLCFFSTVITAFSTYYFSRYEHNTPEVRKYYAAGIMFVALINFFIGVFLMDTLLFFPAVCWGLYQSARFSIDMYNKACIEKKFKNLQDSFRDHLDDKIIIYMANISETFFNQILSLIYFIQTYQKIECSEDFQNICLMRVTKDSYVRSQHLISAEWFESTIFPGSYDQEEIKDFFTFILCLRTFSLVERLPEEIAFVQEAVSTTISKFSLASLVGCLVFCVEHRCQSFLDKLMFKCFNFSLQVKQKLG